MLASFSHISSLPSAILPVKRLAALCHEHGVLVLIDGAHAPGQMAVDVKDVGADFYVGDGHKWMFTPKGVAFLWASEAVQDLLYGPVVDGQGTFADWFSWQGLDDYSKCECKQRSVWAVTAADSDGRPLHEQTWRCRRPCSSGSGWAGSRRSTATYTDWL